MSTAAHDRALSKSLERLAALGVAPAVAPALRRTVRDLEAQLQEAVLGEVQAFRDSHNPEILPDLRDHAKAHVQEILRLGAGGEIGDFAFVKAHARRRAEQRFPLEATLHAYRCGHRVLSRWLRDGAAEAVPDRAREAIDAVADFSIEYTNAISATLAAEYVASTRLIEAAEGDRRTELLNILLAGYDESDGRIARLLKGAGYLDQRQSYCAVAIRTPNATEMDQAARAQRILVAVAEVLAPTGVRWLGGFRHGHVVGVASAQRRLSGWTAPQTRLADRLTPLLMQLGISVLVGLSADQPSTAAIPRALREALAAAEFATVGRRVVAFAGLPVRSLLIHAGGEYVRSAAPGWAAALIEADRKSGHLLATLEALADADLNVQAAGRQLGVHPNTVYARLGRIRDLTGLDGRRHHDLAELQLATECARL